MFRRLSEALPEHIVLSEVGYQAFLTRRVDFLILDQAGGIVAAVELDGASHDQDKRLVRWRAEGIPKGTEIRERVLGASA